MCTRSRRFTSAWFLDRDPSGLTTSDSRRDSPLDDTDSFRIVLDTYRDRQNGLVFATTPSGLEYDGQLNGEGTNNPFGGGGGGGAVADDSSKDPAAGSTSIGTAHGKSAP